MNKYPVLQSGFIALNEDILTKPEKHADFMVKDVLSQDYRNTFNKRFYSHEITKLYLQYLNNNKVLNNFEFRESILTQAFLAFNCNTLSKWLMIQNTVANLTSLHKNFIEDTFSYLRSAKERSLEVSQWNRLLEYNDVNKGIEINLKNVFGDQGYNDKINNYVLPVSLAEVIQLWVTKPNGFQDLLVSLQVIFGKRVDSIDVAEKNSNG